MTATATARRSRARPAAAAATGRATVIRDSPATGNLAWGALSGSGGASTAAARRGPTAAPAGRAERGRRNGERVTQRVRQRNLWRGPHGQCQHLRRPPGPKRHGRPLGLVNLPVRLFRQRQRDYGHFGRLLLVARHVDHQAESGSGSGSANAGESVEISGAGWTGTPTYSAGTRKRIPTPTRPAVRALPPAGAKTRSSARRPPGRRRPSDDLRRQLAGTDNGTTLSWDRPRRCRGLGALRLRGGGHPAHLVGPFRRVRPARSRASSASTARYRGCRRRPAVREFAVAGLRNNGPQRRDVRLRDANAILPASRSWSRCPTCQRRRAWWLKLDQLRRCRAC